MQALQTLMIADVSLAVSCVKIFLCCIWLGSKLMGWSAGCPVAVGNLWDVTDRDIDRFAMTLLEKWLPEGGGEGGMQEAKAEQENRDTQHDTGRMLCVSQSVSDSRNVCRLPHLIGAAPVCYGVPTSVLLQ